MKRLAWLGVLASSSFALAQSPVIPAGIPLPQRGPSPIVPDAPRVEPNQLPPQIIVPPSQPSVIPQVVLPREEGFIKLDANQLQVRRSADTTQLWQNGLLFRDYGKFDREAEDVVRYLRTSRPTLWTSIGGPKPVVEYGLRDGTPTKWNPAPRWTMPIDPGMVRTQNIRGAWVVRDDRNILLNFGVQREEAEQAVGVVRKYNFNRIGMIGFPNPVMTYFYVSDTHALTGEKLDATAMLNAIAQENSLQKTGIPIAGVGFVGEKLQFDARKVEIRKDRGEYVLAHGTDLLGRFGYNDWVARDALRLIQECRFTEYCTFGGAGVSFFLVNGQAPTRVPFFAQGLKFDTKNLKVRPAEANRWGVFEPGGRMILPAVNQQEAEVLLKLMNSYGFDTLCSVGNPNTAGLKFLAKTGPK